MLVHMTDGFDLLAISFAGPAIDRKWMLGPECLGELFNAASSVWLSVLSA